LGEFFHTVATARACAEGLVIYLLAAKDHPMSKTQREQAERDSLVFLAAGGEMGERTRAFDWSQTPVGPVSEWPQSLKTAVSICLGSRYPIVLWWGREALTQFYNDGFISFLGSAKHPVGLGPSARASCG